MAMVATMSILPVARLNAVLKMTARQATIDLFADLANLFAEQRVIRTIRARQGNGPDFRSG